MISGSPPKQHNRRPLSALLQLLVLWLPQEALSAFDASILQAALADPVNPNAPFILKTWRQKPSQTVA